MVNPIINTLTDEVTQIIGVAQSATALINGFQTRLEAAIAAALANGATEGELAPLTDLEAALETERVALANAVAANPGPTPLANRR